ncbi:C39 family peptidase [Ferviditalea candida]|uniref:C39 family peptidase n=1 Tax=Ferviditalea candida TaxID=3108399 RepID=A0ABU5ZGP7_9BACL|nr:C39 family peptidase [Paenibacillaceae bacterium T2]
MKIFILLVLSSAMLFGCNDRKDEFQSRQSSESVEKVQVARSLQQKSDQDAMDIRRTLNQGAKPNRATSKQGDMNNRPQAAGIQRKKLLDVPLIAQNPELKYGCEVTSLTMLIRYAGIKADKMKLYREVPKDLDPVKKSKSGDITHWGNPRHGFVGDMTGRRMGYAVYDKPLEKLLRRYLGNRTLNLTGQPFDRLLDQVKSGRPVVVWTTGDYKLPDRWESWMHGNERIRTPLDLHAVVLVGYDANHVYLNDPLSVKKNVRVKKSTFIQSWRALGKQALSYQ